MTTTLPPAWQLERTDLLASHPSKTPAFYVLTKQAVADGVAIDTDTNSASPTPDGLNFNLPAGDANGVATLVHVANPAIPYMRAVFTTYMKNVCVAFLICMLVIGVCVLFVAGGAPINRYFGNYITDATAVMILWVAGSALIVLGAVGLYYVYQKRAMRLGGHGHGLYHDHHFHNRVIEETVPTSLAAHVATLVVPTEIPTTHVA